jgi:hypothetical protein
LRGGTLLRHTFSFGFGCSAVALARLVCLDLRLVCAPLLLVQATSAALKGWLYIYT